MFNRVQKHWKMFIQVPPSKFENHIQTHFKKTLSMVISWLTLFQLNCKRMELKKQQFSFFNNLTKFKFVLWIQLMHKFGMYSLYISNWWHSNAAFFYFNYLSHQLTTVFYWITSSILLCHGSGLFRKSTSSLWNIKYHFYKKKIPFLQKKNSSKKSVCIQT